MIARFFVLTLIILGWFNLSTAQNNLNKLDGYVVEKDTLTAISFAYIVNQKTGLGTVSDERGYFQIQAKETDTLLLSSLGYYTRKITVADLKKTPLWQQKKSVQLFLKTISLQTFVVIPKYLTPNEKSFYERYIEQPKPGPSSPISLIYYSYSKEGKQRQKLEEIYKREIFYEKAERRLEHFFKTKKVDLSKFDSRAFINYCGLTPEQVYYGSDYDFYYKISRCYDSYTQNDDYR